MSEFLVLYACEKLQEVQEVVLALVSTVLVFFVLRVFMEPSSINQLRDMSVSRINEW